MSIDIPLTDKQQIFMAAMDDNDIDAICYGGARKGGKSYIGRMAVVLRRCRFPGTNGLIMRETTKEVETNHVDPIKSFCYNTLGMVEGSDFKYNVNDSFFTFPKITRGGVPSKIFLGYGQYLDQAKVYQGNPYLDIFWDERTNIASDIVRFVNGSLANEHYPETVPKQLQTCNPGGVASDDVYKEFVNPSTRRPRSIFIQAFVQDNPFFMASDPGFIARLEEEYKEEPWILEQWLKGNWNASPNSYFAFDPEIGGRHVRHIDVPHHAYWYAGIDEGYWPDPFACVWFAKWQDVNGGHHVHFVDDLGAYKKDYDEQAKLVLEREKTIPNMPPRPKIRFCDPQTNAHAKGQKRNEGESSRGATHTCRTIWRQHGLATQSAHKYARDSGWMLMRFLLKHNILTMEPACMGLRQEMKAAQYEKTATGVLTGDLSDATGDHFLDAARYGLVETFGLQFPKSQKGVWEEHARREEERRRTLVVIG